jgi:CheY-like chemotaxis protein
MTATTGLDANPFTSARARRRSRIRGRRILYVDDEPLLRLAVARLVRGAGGLCIGTATHAQAVVQLALEPRVDLAILDFQMPDGDVDDLVRVLRRRRPGLVMVGTSASDRRSDFAARGIDRFLQKPWSLDDLIRVAEWSDVSVDRAPTLAL